MGWIKALELLVEKVLISANEPLTPAEAFRHIFEAVATGVLQPSKFVLQKNCMSIILGI